MDMHLVWTNGRIFLKPIPPILLEPSFWTNHFSCEQGCMCSKVTDTPSCKQGLQARALGFLSSYTALISYHGDFLLAQQKYLIPKEVKWLAWRRLVRQIVEIDDIDRKIDRQFIYGELRLDRLNMVYLVSGHPREYMLRWNQYNTFFQDNLSWLAGGTVYIAIVLTAMQVGLATSLANNDAFQLASYGFTVFSILSPLIAAAPIMLVFSFMSVNNLVEAVRYSNKRFRDIS